MKIGRETIPRTAICAANGTTIVVRGRDLCAELIGRRTFSEYFWLLVTGVEPTDVQSRMLDASLVAVAEHGLVPSVQASRMTMAAAPECMQGAVAAGLLGCGSVILGAAESAGRLLSDIVTHSCATGADLHSAAVAALQRCLAESRSIPGYGHPLHKDRDPRAHVLLSLARQLGVHERHCQAAQIVESSLHEVTGKQLKMNVSVALPAVLLDVGFPAAALKGIPLLARTAGLIGHLLEELQRPIGFALSYQAARAAVYDGEAPDGFQPEV
jgi:citrate synthase